MNKHLFIISVPELGLVWVPSPTKTDTLLPRHHQRSTENSQSKVSPSSPWVLLTRTTQNQEGLVRSPEWHPSSLLLPLRTYSELPRYPCLLSLHHSGSPTHQTKLIQESYNPTSLHRLSPEEHRRLQSELYELQRRWEAWGLVIPFLFEHADPNVQFFGAHTAQVKISRDWYVSDTHSRSTPPPSYAYRRESFPTIHGDELIQFLLNITGRSISLSLGKVILRKLFVAVCRLSSSSLSSFLCPHVIHYSSPVICACSEACAPRPFSLAKLDRCDLYGALYRRGNY